ncbi:MAG: AbrB/MazE/SpoVT family DNA-binding domain-containing protein [Deinococcus sp.]|nr:AbrB/MazE/SpoVT family DNA-binding domain-containing protein [Deinococcus sp.]
MTKTARITSKGQVTIPVEVRAALRLRQGDTVMFEIDEQGQARLRLVQDKSRFAKYAGALREGKGLTAKKIVRHIRKQRGW